MSTEPQEKNRFDRAFTGAAYVITFGVPALLFAWFIWPTPWRTQAIYIPRVNGLGHHYHVHYLRRVNVFTGENQCGHSGMFGMVNWHPCTSK